MLSLTTILIAWLSVIASQVCAFQDVSRSAIISNRHRILSVHIGTSTILQESKSSDHLDDNSQAARRSFLGKLALIPFAALQALTTTPTTAQASGGATAGGAYLLSAKKRYYERVKASVSGLLQAADGLKNGDSKVAKDYFSGDADGSWKDLTAAGYLLSNAFRRSSSTAPDSLPAVKVRINHMLRYKLARAGMCF